MLGVEYFASFSTLFLFVQKSRRGKIYLFIYFFRCLTFEIAVHRGDQSTMIQRMTVIFTKKSNAILR